VPDAIIKEALEQFSEAQELTGDWRKVAETDLRFANGDQWPEELRAWRESQRLPCLTIDRLDGAISQLVGDQRQNDLAVKVVSKSLEANDLTTADKSTISEGDFISGLVRDIQRRSRFEWVQALSFEHAVQCGLGGWYLDTEYSAPDSFDQHIAIRRIPNPLSIYPDARNWATTDGMEYGFVIDHFTQEAFKKAYPKANGSFEAADEWGCDEVRTAIWWKREYTSDTLIQLRLPTGDIITALQTDLDILPPPEGSEQLNERKTRTAKVMRRVITANEVLEETEWPGRYVPLSLVVGHESWLDGRLDWSGMVRKAKDPQMLYNLNRSSVAEIMGGAPKVPYILTAEQVRGHEKMWAGANVGNKPYLLINPDPKAPGWPQRQQIAYPEGFAREAIVAAGDVMAVTKIHEASLGQRSNETSGVAIQARQREGDTGNYIFTDNLLLAVEETGRIIVDAIPRVYDSTRVVTSRSRDGTTTAVHLNSPEPGGVRNRLTGKYDTEVTAGPAFGTARQESVAAITSLAQAAPQLLQVGADIWVGNMDWPGADELAARLKKLVPPELLAEGKGQKPEQQMAQMQAAIQQMQQQLQQAQQMAEQAAQALQQTGKEAEQQQAEITSLSQRLEAAKLEAGIVKKQHDLEIATMKAEDVLKAQFDEAQDVLRNTFLKDQGDRNAN